MANHTVEALWRWSAEGELPVVIDASSCSLGLASEAAASLTEENRERHAKLEILDSVAWAKRLLPKLEIRRKLGSVAVHPTCSTRHLGLERQLREIAGVIADEVVQPIRATCCGMAGDRGMLHPELTRSGDGGGGRRAGGLRARRLPLQQPDLRDRPPAGDRRGLRVLRDPARAGQPALSSETGAGRPSW